MVDGVERFARIVEEYDVSRASLTFGGKVARLSFSDADVELRFESSLDEPEVSWRGDTLLLTASRITVVEGDEEFEVPMDEPTTVKLAGVPHPDEWSEQ